MKERLVSDLSPDAQVRTTFLSLVQLGDQVCDHYDFLHRDLLLAGLVLHDVGKDEIDSKLEAMRAQYATDQDRPGDWTARNPALRRELLKIARGTPASSNGPGPEKP
jgi:23S rRNA maturation-related 3'-5' exoribonuclease YhaM